MNIWKELITVFVYNSKCLNSNLVKNNVDTVKTRE